MPDNYKIPFLIDLNVSTKALEEASKSSKQLSAFLDKLHKSARVVRDSFLALGKSVNVLAGGALATFTQSIKLSGSSLLKFQITSANATNSIDKLKASYGKMSSTVKGSLSSLSDLSNLLAGFQSRGIFEGFLGMQESFQGLSQGLQESLFRVFGKEQANEMINNFFSSFSENFDLLNDAVPGLENNLSQINKLLKSGNTKGAASAYRDLASQVQSLMAASSNPTVIRDFSNALTSVANSIELSGDGSVNTFTKFQEIVNRISTTVENVLNNIAQVFGGDLANLLDWVNEKVVAIGEGIKEWVSGGGLEKVRQYVIDIYNWWADTFRLIRKSMLWIIGEEEELKPDLKGTTSIAEDIYKIYQKIENTDIDKPIEDLDKKAKNALGTFQSLEVLITEMTAKSKRLGQITSVFDSIGNSMQQLGPNSILYRMMSGDFDQSISQISNSLSSSLAALSEAQTAFNSINDPTQREALYSKVMTITAEINKITSDIKKKQEFSIANQKTEAIQIEIIKNLRAEDLRISQALYGTPALAVESQLKLAQSLEQQKRILMDQLKQQDILISQIEEQIKLEGNSETAKVLQESLFGLANERLKTELEIKKTISEQLETVKSLRDGYLDAVQASAFGAGAFEKIIIDQEKNLGAALDKRNSYIKNNFLLGSTGARSDVSSYRFNASGIGALSKADGTSFGSSDLDNRLMQAINGVDDPTQKAAIAQASRIVQQTYRYTSDLQKSTTESQVKALNDNTDAINNLASSSYSRAAGVAGMKGNAAITFAGEAYNQATRLTPYINNKAHYEGKEALMRHLYGISNPVQPNKNTGSTSSNSSSSVAVSDNFTKKAEKVQKLLAEAGQLIRSFGPILDEVDRASSSSSSTNSIKGGNFILPSLGMIPGM